MVWSKIKKQNYYFYYYVQTNELKSVGKKAFCNSKARVVQFGRSLVRIIGDCNRSLVINALHGIVPQGIFDTLLDLKNAFSILITIIQNLKNINKKVVVSFARLVLDIMSFYNSPSVTGEQIINILLSMYLFREELQPQGLDSLLLAGISTFLPPKVFEIIRRAQFLTSAKICDDPSLLYSVLGCIFSFIEDLVKFVPGAKFALRIVKDTANFFNVGKHHVLLKTAEKLLSDSQDNKILLVKGFRDKVNELQKKIIECLELQEWSRRSVVVKNVLQKWDRLVKLVANYGNPYRQEPCCFIFEGPPGTMKSVILNNIVEALGEPCYSHIVKSVDNGKDFYDNYNNEPIFYMDDLGQEGVSQWRTMMNMVSAVKLPLDCAEASLKDTKFFNSDKIFITTNRFQNIVGLTKADCIDDIKALHRRGYVFDFSQVRREGDFIVGTILFKYYLLSENRFVNAFPPEFERIVNLRPSFSIERGDSRVELLAWFVSIIKIFEKIKKTHLFNNKLSDSELEILKQRVEELIPQGFLSFNITEEETSEEESEEEEEENTLEDEVKVVLENLIIDCDSSLKQYWLNTNPLQMAKRIFQSEWWHDILKFKISHFVSQMVTGIQLYVQNSTSIPSSIIKLCTAALIGSFIGLLAKWLCGSSTIQEDLKPQSNFKFDIENVHSSVPYISNNLHSVDLLSGNQVSQCVGLFSGHFVLIPAHLAASEEINIVVYADRGRNSRLVDGDKVSRVLLNREEDVAIYQFSPSFPTPFKKIYHLIKDTEIDKDISSFLVSESGWCPVGQIKNHLKTRVRTYKQVWPNGEVFVGTLKEGSFTSYDVQAPGLCGSVVYNVDNGIMGMHVAGDSVNNQGVSILWSRGLREKIIDILKAKRGVELPFDIKELKKDNISVVKLDGKVYAPVPNATNFGPSPLFGLYPVTRSPANLCYSGKHTVKDIAKKSFSPCKLVSSDEIEFGKKVLRSMLVDFEDLNESDVVGGTSLLAPLNKKSSNGYKCEKDKEFYIDFENKSFTPVFRETLMEFESKLDNYELDWEKLAWVETLKDELRNEEKDGEPRSFRVGTIYNQVLTKKYFGKMVEHIISNRKQNQIMIGCNPIKEWPDIYKKLLSGSVFAGDVKKWDGSMLTQVQRAVLDVIMEFYKGGHTAAASIILNGVFQSILIVQDDLYLTTHSMSSGSFLTAILNSMVNKFYTAMWFYRCLVRASIPPTIDGFWRNVDDFVYGDDKLNVVRAYHNLLNAITMRDFFISIGMDFTDASKKSIETPFQDITEVSFLKRSFVWHSDLKQIVCPLELRTLFSGLSYVDYCKSIEDVMRDKINAFQREIYLHAERKELIADFVSRMNKRKYDFDLLSEHYLYSIYSDPNFAIPLSWSGVNLYC